MIGTIFEFLSLGLAVFIVAMFLFMAGVLPVPVGYDRGKIRWIKWCGTGMHAHIVYWHSKEAGRTDRASFQSIHPADMSEGKR
jgi:hypothetical protein